eukprot:Opistho-2@48148
MATEAGMQFAPFASAVDIAFWHALSKQKLENFKLDETPRPIWGSYAMAEFQVPASLQVGPNAFEEPKAGASQGRQYPVPGTIYNTNTMDSFKALDKKALLDECGAQIWDDIVSGRAAQSPSLLSRFLLVAHADLKKHHFFYWFAFPALVLEGVTCQASQPLAEAFSEKQRDAISAGHTALGDGGSHFVIRIGGDGGVAVGPLAQWAEWHASGDASEILLGFADPCPLPSNPGWPLRNLLVAALAHGTQRPGPTLRVVCFRGARRDGAFDSSSSIVQTLGLPEGSISVRPKIVGWEKNVRDKLGPRMVDLSATMDPARLAETAVTLNLQLMRWRLLPSLDLERIAGTRCLLLGAGTLGCNVARCLMGWGVRKITFVDSGAVSFSNPARQSLFEFEDCLAGGKPKAKAAAEHLKKIFPGMDSEGVSMSIPMPGHAVSEESAASVRADVVRLEGLIDDHDVVFLLMDTRESRWLPSVIASSRGKWVINSALGFDSYLVMRHGARRRSADGSDYAPSLGCYFCNDVMAPANSMRDRTLDQQCTVSRPGLSFIAAASAVELLVSLTQHADGIFAPADVTGGSTSQPLGLIPHQIRGFLSNFTNVLPHGHAFDKCTACSSVVIAAYRERGFEFLRKAFDSPTYLRS